MITHDLKNSARGIAFERVECAPFKVECSFGVEVSPEQMDGAYMRWGKRIADVVLALVMIILSAPLLLLVAAAVKLTSSGPVLFIHKRVGRDGKLFNFLKFRSMYTNQKDFLVSAKAQKMAEKGILLKVDDDPRVTAVGRFMRRTSIDELPQLFNVLRGDMSFVGPRPLIDFMVKDYPLENAIRSKVRPGITGFWQVYARSDCNGLNQMLGHDVRYVREASFLTDFKLLLLTIPAVISCRGAR